MGAGPVTCKTLNLQSVTLQGQALVVMSHSEQSICKTLDTSAMGSGPVTCKTLNLQSVTLQGQALVVMRQSERPICKMLDYCAMGAGLEVVGHS